MALITLKPLVQVKHEIGVILDREPLASILQKIRLFSLGKHKAKAKKFIFLALCFEFCSFLVLRASPLGAYLEAQIEPLFGYILHNSTRVASVEIMPKTMLQPTMSRIISDENPVPFDTNNQHGLAQSILIMAADGPFSIISSGAAGEFQIRIYQSGQANNAVFGSLVDYVGPVSGCGKTSSLDPQIVFASNFATAPNVGAVIDQAVLVEILYDQALEPKFAAVSLSQDQYKKALPKTACSETEA